MSSGTGGNAHQRKISGKAAQKSADGVVAVAATAVPVPPPKRERALGRKFHTFHEQASLWGGIGMIGAALIIGAIGRIGGLLFGWIFVAIAVVRSAFFPKGCRTWLGNAVLLLAIAAILWAAYKWVPVEASLDTRLDKYFATYGKRVEHETMLLKMRDQYHRLEEAKDTRAQLFVTYCAYGDEISSLHRQESIALHGNLPLSVADVLGQETHRMYDTLENNRLASDKEEAQYQSLLAEIQTTFTTGANLDALIKSAQERHGCESHKIGPDVTTLADILNWTKAQNAKNMQTVGKYYVQPSDALLAYMKSALDHQPPSN
jgi:hypothetical protein